VNLELGSRKFCGTEEVARLGDLSGRITTRKPWYIGLLWFHIHQANKCPSYSVQRVLPYHNISNYRQGCFVDLLAICQILSRSIISDPLGQTSWTINEPRDLQSRQLLSLLRCAVDHFQTTLESNARGTSKTTAGKQARSREQHPGFDHLVRD
jgi:hypothetical protein